MDINKNNGKDIIIKSNIQLECNMPSRRSEREVNEEVSPETRVRVIESKRKSKSPVPMGMIFTIAAITVLFVFLLMNYAEMNNYSSEIAEMRDELTELQKTADKLEQRLDKKNDLVYIEEYATKTMGMVKGTQIERINITATPENGGEAYRYDDRVSGLGTLLNGFGEIIKDFFD